MARLRVWVRFGGITGEHFACDPLHFVELRLQGLSTSDIAAKTGRAERSIRRILAHVQQVILERDEAE
jgi:hypothetical protein